MIDLRPLLFSQTNMAATSQGSETNTNENKTKRRNSVGISWDEMDADALDHSAAEHNQTRSQSIVLDRSSKAKDFVDSLTKSINDAQEKADILVKKVGDCIFGVFDRNEIGRSIDASDVASMLVML